MLNVSGVRIRQFLSNEEGLALTEYLVILGILIGAIIGAVILFGEGVEGTYELWASWFSTNLRP